MIVEDVVKDNGITRVILNIIVDKVKNVGAILPINERWLKTAKELQEDYPEIKNKKLVSVRLGGKVFNPWQAMQAVQLYFMDDEEKHYDD
jgi:mitochondrial fission protein ELM1